jgi:hypothetical protein
VKVRGFHAAADIVGHRVTVRWTFVLDPGETLADLPPVVLRRKTRDFEFPAGMADRFIVYDSGAFPPPGTDLVEVDLGQSRSEGGGEVTATAATVATGDPQPFEVLRRTRAVERAADGTVAGVTDTVLDVGARREGLSSGTAYYYELTSAADASVHERAVARATGSYGTARTLYEQLPAIHRRHDVTVPAVRATGQIPEAVPVNGQLRRFVDLFGAAADHLRSRADGLRDLHDADEVDHRLLRHLAATIGWELNEAQPIPQQRHEIRYAPHLFGLTGTVPGCLAWFKRLTGWDADLHEFWRNVFLTNDLGNPDDPDDPGSRTVDTSDEATVAAMGTAGDEVDYTYDTEVGQEHWYAHNVVGFFATPAAAETVEEVTRRGGRALAPIDRFLPCNMRAVVVLDVPSAETERESVLSLTTALDEGG